MSLNWDLLNEKTADFRASLPFKSEDGKKIVDLRYSGLKVTLSELQKNLDAETIFLGVWADTFVVDTNKIIPGSISVFARCIEVSGDASSGISLAAARKDVPATGQFLVDGASKGLILKTPDASINIPSDKEGVLTVMVDHKGKSSVTTDASYRGFKDIINRPLAFNAFKASYMAATELINKGDADSLNVAKSMLLWIVTSIGRLGMDNNLIPGTFSELYCQASATFATINVKAGAYYVPVLSGDYYAKQAEKLISALEAYERDLQFLSTSQNVENAVAQISANLEGVSALQREPLQKDLENVVQNAVNLGNSIQELRFQWDLNNLVAEQRQVKLYHEIRDANLNRYLKSFVETAINVGKTAYDIAKLVQGKPDASIGDAFKDGAAAIMSAYSTYKYYTAEVKPDPLVKAAGNLVESQKNLADSFISSSGIWNELKNNKPISGWPLPSKADAFDPELQWGIFLTEVERVLSNLDNASIGDKDFSDKAQEAAIDYLASLKVLAQYGKAISSKMVAYSQLLVSAIKLRSEIDANQKIQANWEALKQRADSDIEKLAALKSILRARMDAIKRSLFVAWTSYRNSYLYLYFETPPANTLIATDMNAAKLKEAFANVGVWVGNLLAPASSKDKIVLPSQDISITFKFTISKDGSAANDRSKEAFAYFTPASEDKSASIMVAIPRDTGQLKGVLPDKGLVPIWVRSAQFYVNGAAANQQGNVILSASTSGTYYNGFPPDRMFRFETQGVEASFAYKAEPRKAYVNWDINPEVYMTPSPFTLWTITFDEDGGDPSQAVELEMVFNIAFLRNSKRA